MTMVARVVAAVLLLAPNVARCAARADGAAVVEVGLDVRSVHFALKTGSDPSRATLSFASGASRVMSFVAAGSELKIPGTASELSQARSVVLSDERISVRGLYPGWAIERFVRPNLSRYPKEMQGEYVRQWDRLPAASEHFLAVEIRLDSAGLEIWLDGRYAGRSNGARPTSVAVEPGQGGAVRELACRKEGSDEEFEPLDVSFLGHGPWRETVLPCPEGPTTIDGVPLIVRGSAPGDVGAVRHVPARAPESNIYLARSPLDGMPETFHFSVPANQYSAAYVLCAVQDEPGAVPEMTARITRFVKQRGVSSDAIMDTSVTLPKPGEKLPPDIRQVGEVSYKSGERQMKSPVYLVRVPLRTGAISDLIFQPHDGPLLGKATYLDFEILGRVTQRRYASGASFPDNRVRSSVKVLAVTLQRSPVVVELIQEQLGNVFANDERPAIAGKLRSESKLDCTLDWTVRDDSERVVQEGSRAMILESGVEQSFRIPLEGLKIGWYAVLVNVRQGTRTYVQIPVSTAILGRDTRQAGVESPYAARTASIMAPPDAQTHGILLQKAGIRGITPMGATLLEAGEKVYGQWNVHGYQIPWITSELEDDAAAEADIERRIRQYIEKYPSARSALIFHESGGGAFPPEMFDKPAPVPDARTAARDQRLFKLASRTCKVYRRRFPHIRLLVGNSGDSLNLLAAMMRMKFPREYIDAMGEESLGQAKMPENPHYQYGNGTALNVWHMKQLARVLGYGDLPVDACSEWKGRLSNDLTDKTKAEWDMRDLLIAWACGFKTIRMPDITDQGSMFYDTEYGSQGAMRRYPLLYPKRSYVAGAALTRVLDCVEFVRQVPMESDTAYVLEFKRYGREYVYACWLPRGAAELRFEFGRELDVVQVGMLGGERALRTQGGRVVVEAGTGPCYLVSPEPLRDVVRGAEVPDPIPAGYVVASAMDRLAEWQLRPRDAKLEAPRSPTNFYGVKAGEFTLVEAADPQKGKCLKLELAAADDDPAARHGGISLKVPVKIPGRPNTIGVWVKGNSSWARLGLEIQDAQGEIWRTSGGDWPANLSVNFDGWHFVRFPTNDTARWPHYVYSDWIAGHWASVGAGNKKIDYPIKLVGISVTMPRQVLNLTRMNPVKHPSLCFRDFGAYEDIASPGQPDETR